MSFSSAHPSLRTRITGDKSWIAIPVNRSAELRTAGVSYTERYRGTEFETHFEAPVESEPLMSRGRMVVIVSAIALAAVIAGALTLAPA